VNGDRAEDSSRVVKFGAIGNRVRSCQFRTCNGFFTQGNTLEIRHVTAA